MDVPVREHAVLVNIGDAFEFWTGCQLKSTIHRVVEPPDGTKTERLSIAYFNQPMPNAVLKCLLATSSLSDGDMFRLQRKGITPGSILTADEHLQMRLSATYTGRKAA